jgi:hypothetical protein
LPLAPPPSRDIRFSKKPYPPATVHRPPFFLSIPYPAPETTYPSHSKRNKYFPKFAGYF